MSNPPLPRLTPVPPQQQPQQRPLPTAISGLIPAFPTWQHVSRYAVNPAAVDTSANGDILVPVNANHLMIQWLARDTTANTAPSFGRMQMAVAGGAILTTASYAWSEVFASTTIAPTRGGVNGDNAINCIATAGGGQAATIFAHGTIWFSFVQTTGATLCTWTTAQINTGDLFTRTGAGGQVLNGGPLTKIRFLASTGSFAVGTVFDLSASA